MSDDSTPKMVSAPIRMSPELAEKVEEAKRLTGLAQADILRLCLAIGLEDLKRVGYDLPRLVSHSARPDLEAAAVNMVSYQAGKEGLERSKSRVAEKPEAAPLKKKGGPHLITLRGSIAAGAPVDAVEEEEMPVGKEYPPDHYALRVGGKSMEPKIPDESIVIVREWRDMGFPKKGTIVVYSDRSGSTLKEFGYRRAEEGDEHASLGKVPVLRSLNKAFPDVQTMEGGKIEAVLVEVL